MCSLAWWATWGWSVNPFRAYTAFCCFLTMFCCAYSSLMCYLGISKALEKKHSKGNRRNIIPRFNIGCSSDAFERRSKCKAQRFPIDDNSLYRLLGSNLLHSIKLLLFSKAVWAAAFTYFVGCALFYRQFLYIQAMKNLGLLFLFSPKSFLKLPYLFVCSFLAMAQWFPTIYIDCSDANSGLSADG